MAGRQADIRYRVFRPAGAIPAGATLDIRLPSGIGWVVRSLAFTLQTDATVANRLPEIRLDDGAGIYFRSGSNVNQAAGATFSYCAFPGAQLAGVGAPAIYIPLDALGLIVPAGHQLQVVAVNGVAGDQFGAVALAVAEYQTGPVAPATPLAEPYVPAFDPSYVG